MTFSSLVKDDSAYLQKIAELILAYSKGPKAEYLCVPEVLNLYLFSIREVPDNILKNSGVIVDLIYFLSKSFEIQNSALICLIQLCELSFARYEQFAICGGIPLIIQLLESNVLIDLSLEIFSMLPGISNGARRKLREAKALKALVKFLHDDRIVEALGRWIKSDPLLEEEVLEPENFEAIAEKISQETRLIKWEGVLESSNHIRKNLYEAVKIKGGNPRVLELIKQEMPKYD